MAGHRSRISASAGRSVVDRSSSTRRLWLRVLPTGSPTSSAGQPGHALRREPLPDRQHQVLDPALAPLPVRLQLGELRGGGLPRQRLRVGVLVEVALAEDDQRDPLLRGQRPGRLGARGLVRPRPVSAGPVRDVHLDEVLAAWRALHDQRGEAGGQGNRLLVGEQQPVGHPDRRPAHVADPPAPVAVAEHALPAADPQVVAADDQVHVVAAAAEHDGALRVRTPLHPGAERADLQRAGHILHPRPLPIRALPW